MKKIILLLTNLLIVQAAYADTVVITRTEVVESTPTISTSIYASGDQIGGKITLANAALGATGTGVISSVTLTDLDKEAADIDVVFFDADFTASSDNAVFDPSDADLLNVICVVSLTTDVAFNDNGVTVANNVNCPFDLGTGTSLYAALVSRGTPTYTSTTDLTLRVGILQD